MIQKTWPILFGNFLEFYEFTLFSALLAIISPILFPSEEILTSFTSGYIFLAIGFLSRPFGAALFGYIGDQYGRKKAVLLSILLMSLSTITIGLLPTYQAVGSYLLLILAVCRICQGLSAGGEYSGAGLLMVEKASEKNRYLNGAVLCSAGVFGAFIAALLTVFISASLLPLESWRVLFLIGGALGFVTLWFRIPMAETLPAQFIEKNPMPWSILIKKYKYSLLSAIIIEGLMNAPFYLIMGFMNTYLAAIGTYSKTTLMLMNAFAILCSVIGVLYFGFLTLRVNAFKMMLFASAMLSLFAFPFFFIIEMKSFPLFLLAELSLALMSVAFNASAFATMAQLFPPPIRYRGLAVGNCIGVALFGGTTPYISMQLIRYTGLSWSPAIYLCGLSLLGFICIWKIKNNQAIIHNTLEVNEVGSLPVTGL